MHLICAILQLECAVALVALFNLGSATWSYGWNQVKCLDIRL